jgi:uncharacterized protein YfeS
MAEEEEFYSIDRDHAHPRALELAPEDFFWSEGDDLSPFGSDEGHIALSECREWRKENPTLPALDCLIWTIESVGEMAIEDYNDSLLSESTIKAQIAEKEFDDAYFIYVLDSSVIATGFGQLVDKGQIDLDSKPLVKRAIERQLLWSKLRDNTLPSLYRNEYQANLQVLTRILQEA